MAAEPAVDLAPAGPSCCSSRREGGAATPAEAARRRRDEAGLAGLGPQQRAKVERLRDRLEALVRTLSAGPAAGAAHLSRGALVSLLTRPRREEERRSQSGGGLTEEKGVLEPEMLDSQTLKRFLVARKWDVAAAYRMYLDYAEHRTRVPRGSVRAAEVAVGLSHRKCFLQRPDTDDGDETVYIVMRRHMAGECSTQEAIDYVQFGFDRVSWARRSGRDDPVASGGGH